MTRTLLVLALGAALLTPLPSADAAPATDAALPVVSPTPQAIERAGKDTPVPDRVRIVTGPDTDAAALSRLQQELGAAGAEEVETVSGDPGGPAAPLTVLLGGSNRTDVKEGLGATTVPAHPEGYALRVSAMPHAVVAIGGVDPAGQFYAVQTLRQLIRDGKIAGASVSDFPSMPLRGSIEGFYGTPWTQAERLDHMDFLGDQKANTYVYAPKDDPYHRDRWRDPYPAGKLAELGQLVERATGNHVRFTFAVSPGGSICYSDPGDTAKLIAKLQAIYDLGGRAFSIPLDDISYTRWNCAGDQTKYGAPGRAAAARAQVDLLNTVQQTFIATHNGARPLQMVPTEYGDLTDTAYKQTMRATLDPAVEVMWTGTDVVPPAITNDQASKAAALFGRKVFVWDNYPVNDYGATSGRLLLAPYDKREAGLSDHLSGIVANPMNQPFASKVALFGVADFTWNDAAYDATRNWHRAMDYLAGQDPAATAALQVFGDLEHLAPTFGPNPWQPQAPELARRVAEFWRTWDSGKPADAVQQLHDYADRIAAAPATIRAGRVQPGFIADAKPWLDATALWGQAMTKTLDSLSARLAGDNAAGSALAGEADGLRTQARAVRVDPPRNTWGAVPPKVGDGVLDTFIDQALDLASHPIAVRLSAKVVFAADGSAKLAVQVANGIAGNASDVSVRIELPGGGTATPTVLDLGSLANGQSADASFTATWPGPVAGRIADVAATVSWTAGGVRSSTTAEAAVQVTSAATPTRPTGVAYVDSEETAGEDGRAVNAIDGDPATIWHTVWSAGNAPYPHEIQLDLGKPLSVSALRYLPRAGGGNGTVAGYQVYLSSDGQTWGTPVATGTFPPGAAEKFAPFALTSTRYVRFVALSEQNGNPWASAAEFSVDAVM
ncbi:beta-N-acetylglucosaminidase domain-containing protein [Kribbella sp. NPDC059898]|uniref:beta-N-acetylglucosaminidase domain-containing protein n=1 Tax=Kribbella sp. NPDC059898 TaxID=3346995 RepID=UPI003662948E